MAFLLSSPVRVGDLANGITLDQLEIASISLNLFGAIRGSDTAVLSVTLIHPASGWQMTVTYRDATALAFWGAIDSATATKLITAIWAKLVADGKLPAGTATPDIPAATRAAAAVATLAAAAAATPAPGALPPPVSAPASGS